MKERTISIDVVEGEKKGFLSKSSKVMGFVSKMSLQINVKRKDCGKELSNKYSFKKHTARIHEKKKPYTGW